MKRLWLLILFACNQCAWADINTQPLVSHISYHYDKPKRSDIRQKYYIYDEKGELIQSKSIYGFGKTVINNFQYNSSGKLLNKLTVTNGEVTSETTYEYNKMGLRVKETEQYPKGNKDERVYHYAPDGSLLSTYLYMNGFQIEEYQYSYNENGSKSDVEKYSKAGITGISTDKTHYEYDKSNHLVKASFHGEYTIGGEVSSTHKGGWTYIYDDKINLVEESYRYESRDNKKGGNNYQTQLNKKYNRNPEGLLIEERHFRIDENNLSKLVKSISYQYLQ